MGCALVRGRLAMGVVWYRLRADVRVGWRALVLIAVVVGVGGGGAPGPDGVRWCPAHGGGGPADAGL
jgi:hypothetical protein